MAKTGTFLGSMMRDDNHEPLQIGTSFQTSDATASPKNSPLAYSSTTITITVPDNAAEFICQPSTDLRVSEVSSMATYYIVRSSTAEAIPCVKMSSIYIVRDSADGTLQFRFTLV